MAASGEIEGAQYWHEGLPTFVALDPASPPSVPLGTRLALGFMARNTGPSTFTGRVDLTVTRPDGSTLRPAAIRGQDTEVLPTQTFIVQYGEAVWDSARNMYVVANGIALDQAGSWKGLAELAAVEVEARPVSCSIYKAGWRYGITHWYCVWWTARLGGWFGDGTGWRPLEQPVRVSGLYNNEDVYLVGYDWGPDVGWLGYGPHGPFRLENLANYSYHLGLGELVRF